MSGRVLQQRDPAGAGVMSWILRIIRTRAARAVMTVLLLTSIPLYVLSYTLVPRMGDFGFYLPGWSGTAYGVQPHGSAWNAGIRDGDFVVVPQSEWLKGDYAAAGVRLHFIVRRGHSARDIEVTAAPAKIDFDVAAAIRAAVNFCLLLFSLLIVARAWNTEFGPLIAACLSSAIFNAAVDRMPHIATTGLLGALMDLDALASGFSFGAYVFFIVILCAAVAGLTSRPLNFLLWAAFINLVLGTANGVSSFPSVSAALSDTMYDISNAYQFLGVFFPVPALLFMLSAARAEYRSRALWLFWGFFPSCLGVSLANLGDLWFVPRTIFNDPIVNPIARGLELSLPVALFYGLLVRRTIDIGFVVNRVAVYGLISAAVLGIFVLLEYLAGRFLETHGAASWAIQLGIAMVIGVSTRYLHGTVDRFVDRVFFAKRHADEVALHRFAQEAEAFTSADALLDAALDVVTARSETSGAAIYLCGVRQAELVRGSNEFPQAVPIDDPLLVAQRRWNEPVDTHDAKTAFPDGMVFPMSARGKLVGALACRTKRDTTAFAPDEREPLMEVARSLARALDALGSRTDASGEAILPLLHSLQTAVATVQQSVATIQRHLAASGETELSA